ncbi:MAG: basic amino acid ABC transporter substrate-binding protein [Ilumatobacteraceae bacterium]
MSRKFRLAAVVATVGLALAACGGGSSSGGDDGETADTTPIDQVELTFQPISAGKLTVCSDAPYEPFEYQDENGNWTGFDMDIMTAVAKRYGLTLEVTKQPFDGIWLAPAAGTCDLVASSITITEERAQNAAFSDPYFDADQSLLVRSEDAATYVDLASLAGKTIAVQTGTTGEAYAKENAGDATVQSFEDAAAMFAALEGKQVDAVLQDLPINAFRAVKQGNTQVTATFPTEEKYGFAMAKDNVDLLDAVNESLNEFRAGGVYDEIYQKYFGTPGAAE